MTAPTFIWVDFFDDPSGPWCGDAFSTDSGDIPYVRDDPEALVQSAHVQALIAAAVEGAAEVAEGWVRRAMHLSPDGYEVERVHGHMAQKAADNIRALTPLDAKAALDRMLQEAKNEALREAAGIIRAKCESILSKQDGKNEAVDANLRLVAVTLPDLADAILSLIQDPPR